MSLRLAIARSRQTVRSPRPVETAKSGKWREDEDLRLRQGVQRYGDDWCMIAVKSVRTRTASRKLRLSACVVNTPHPAFLTQNAAEGGPAFGLLKKIWH
ncbi:hypothetical protein V5O48_009579 [Marasmius crinis-equi]|uniref:Myb-like domain-containing protein n=1 Tax=Marasmius crinis-equi TaxID=585013 RepID=A0ABR3FAQ6_9AGAR